MKINTLEMLEAFFNPTTIKIFILATLFAVLTAILRGLARRGLKNFKLKPAKTSTLIVVAIIVAILTFFTYESL